MNVFGEHNLVKINEVEERANIVVFFVHTVKKTYFLLQTIMREKNDKC